jgi:hypothetical protein
VTTPRRPGLPTDAAADRAPAAGGHTARQPGSAGPPTRKAPKERFWYVVLIAAVCFIAGLGLVIWKLPQWLNRDTATPVATTAQAGEARRIRATLFYVSEDGNQLDAVQREVPFGAGAAAQARRITEMQLAPAPNGLVSPIPSGTSVRNVYVTSTGDAYVDLSHDITAGHSGGSLDEALTVFAIVNALTTNLPDIKAVQILIDGKEVDTLAGHLDLRRPLARAPQWVRKDTLPK